jgi:hypothetical protein
MADPLVATQGARHSNNPPAFGRRAKNGVEKSHYGLLILK